MPAAAELVLSRCLGHIVLDHVDGPGRAHRPTQVAGAYRGSCAARDRPYAAAILGHEVAAVVPDGSPGSRDP